ncbi:excalibur calcium-binding domain-containing protein [Thioclava sp. GXIMD4215]|uniref:excalibur calcium-binding domain-containing protein n=1 Tax=Thioclava sp. GXIMD4215 TaxID=3131928 RepID=UPI0038735F71
MRGVVAALFALALCSGPARAASLDEQDADQNLSARRQFAASYSCSPRKTCKRISSCEEARWLLANCSWGGALDRDSDGVPCETLCPGG